MMRAILKPNLAFGIVAGMALMGTMTGEPRFFTSAAAEGEPAGDNEELAQARPTLPNRHGGD